MIVLLGASGYVGSAFVTALQQRQWDFTPLSRQKIDYTRFDVLLAYLQRVRPSFLINAAGYTGVPNVDACESARAETLFGNTLFPQTVAQACLVAGVPWGHVSSGCIYAGAKIAAGSTVRIEKDLTRPEAAKVVRHHPGSILGYTETDEPNFSFRSPPTSFYSATKALAEEAIAVVSVARICGACGFHSTSSTTRGITSLRSSSATPGSTTM
ncbi:MAG: sugar nucleotide-binding protein [Verrucomicrobiota bacterium]